LLAEFPDIAIYGGRLTLGIMRGRLREHPIDAQTLERARSGAGRRAQNRPVHRGVDTRRALIPDACGLAITTDLGTVIQTGDFKFDQTPVDGRTPQFSRFAQYGEKRSTRFAVRHHQCRSTRTCGWRVDGASRHRSAFCRRAGRIFVATFASNVHRVQQVLDIAQLYNRRVAFTGRSMLTITGIATELGYLKPPTPVLDIAQIDDYADDEICVVMTGAQGEPMAALSKMARNQNRFIGCAKTTPSSCRALRSGQLRAPFFKVINALCLNGHTVYRAPIMRCTFRVTATKKI
jgi:ribonuclease J